MTTFATF